MNLKTLKKIRDKIISTRLGLLLTEGAIANRNDGEWIIRSIGNDRRKIPVLSELVGSSIGIPTRHASSKHKRRMKQDYTKSGFVEIEDGDIVFDVGAYVGGFTEIAARNAKEVYAIEPNTKIMDSLHYNTQNLINVTIIPKAAWKEKTKIEVNQSLFPNDNSIFQPDDLSIGQSFTVQAETIHQIAIDNCVEKIHFLKVEAEGAEPEVLQGALGKGIRIEKISVNTGPERNGETTTDKVADILYKNGYEVIKGYVVFGRL